MAHRFVKCTRCGHRWPTKITPRQCPQCKSPYWDKPRVRKRRKIKKV